ncbi:MAG: nucleoside triphosphate pyrophosphohydrolase [Dehalococcoidia bacterium]|jgi:tetrapyrrole methylase family protein/MazG family protein|nr:nucleoside triphosphate pyrophosphohydrolase [Dehalococcoidia bacterium]MDP6782194.1 nucleoside triphosphate pyrophosphohydrolase [Dehalococcoidia bacterium]
MPNAQGGFPHLKRIISRLRRSCPWDREQTHRSLASNLLEECYEALDAIDQGDPARMREEMGDILMQVLLQAEIAAGEGEFTIDDVIKDTSAKLVHRHPHIFGSARAGSPQDVLDNWDRLKQERKGGSLLDGVPRHLPALAQSQELQSRAARAGFDWKDMEGVLDKVSEEVDELRRAASPQEREDEFGDLLFSLVNLCRHLEIDGETALRRTTGRFRQRFNYMEAVCQGRGQRLEHLSMDELESLWQEAKQQVDR